MKSGYENGMKIPLVEETPSSFAEALELVANKLVLVKEDGEFVAKDVKVFGTLGAIELGDFPHRLPSRLSLWTRQSIGVYRPVKDDEWADWKGLKCFRGKKRSELVVAESSEATRRIAEVVKADFRAAHEARVVSVRRELKVTDELLSSIGIDYHWKLRKDGTHRKVAGKKVSLTKERFVGIIRELRGKDISVFPRITSDEIKAIAEIQRKTFVEVEDTREVYDEESLIGSVAKSLNSESFKKELRKEYAKAAQAPLTYPIMEDGVISKHQVFEYPPYTGKNAKGHSTYKAFRVKLLVPKSDKNPEGKVYPGRSPGKEEKLFTSIEEVFAHMGRKGSVSEILKRIWHSENKMVPAIKTTIVKGDWCVVIGAMRDPKHKAARTLDAEGNPMSIQEFEDGLLGIGDDKNRPEEVIEFDSMQKADAEMADFFNVLSETSSYKMLPSMFGYLDEETGQVHNCPPIVKTLAYEAGITSTMFTEGFKESVQIELKNAWKKIKKDKLFEKYGFMGEDEECITPMQEMRKKLLEAYLHMESPPEEKEAPRKPRKPSQDERRATMARDIEKFTELSETQAHLRVEYEKAMTEIEAKKASEKAKALEGIQAQTSAWAAR